MSSSDSTAWLFGGDGEGQRRRAPPKADTPTRATAPDAAPDDAPAAGTDEPAAPPASEASEQGARARPAAPTTGTPAAPADASASAAREASAPATAPGDDGTAAAPEPAPKRRGRPPGSKTRSRGKAAGSKGDDGKTSPMMRQYFQAKKEVGDALLFFRMGDFYELFHEDAREAARVLGITLTARSKANGGIPMAGVPAKAYEGYLHSLIRAGYRVAICDQVEDPKQAKGIVERRVTRIVTAGTLYEDDLLDRGTSNFLLAVQPAGELCGLAWLDVSTGAFHVAELPTARVADEVSRLDPAEVVLPEVHLDGGDDGDASLADALRRVTRAPLVPGAAWTFERENARQLLHEILGVATLEGFGLSGDEPLVSAAGAALAYVRETQRGQAPPVSSMRRHDPTARAGLDRATRSCLELIATQREGRRDGSLLSVMDETGTAMGARLLREWLVAPLIEPEAIVRRQSAVAELVDRRDVHADIAGLLADVPDVERIATRLLADRGSPRDLAALRTALRVAPALRERLTDCASVPLAEAAQAIEPLPELLDLLERGLAETPAATLAEGGLIAPGWNATLDELRTLRENGAEAIARFQAEESERTGIPSLKVGFNKVFGYYIEVTHAQAAQAGIPDHYIRKQTLTSAERYITPELKELETSILTAEEKSRSLETELFYELRTAARKRGEHLRKLARSMARVDVLSGFARLARERGWVRPTVDDGDVIDVQGGRHPVLDARLPAGEFVPNDVRLDRDGARLVLITGPNMAGKSTYIRQTALLVLLAQVGSFVPADSATIGVVDRIFTRVGAADDLSGGASTFMVEMTETAAILNGATDRSLVILDEVGRGTSTWDGLSIAWAISEYLYKRIGARTLFATHYHELVDLADEFPAVKNVNVAVREWGEEIVFLHKIVAGGTDRSYGLHVARLAGVPRDVIERARRILDGLERSAPDLRPGKGEAPAGTDVAVEAELAVQAPLFPRPVASLVQELAELDIDQVAPMDALLMLQRWQARLDAGDAPDEAAGEAGSAG